MLSTGYVMENEIYFYGVEGGPENMSMKIWLDFIKTFKPQYVFDVGASTGYFGLLEKAMEVNMMVSFFEPLPKAIEILEKNLDANGFSANIFPYALSDYEGDGHFYMEQGTDFAYSITLNDNAEHAITGKNLNLSKQVKVETKVKKLSNLMTEQKLQVPDLVKIDVETHEFEVLSGFGSNIANVDAYLIEILTDECATKLNILFQDKDFRYFDIDDKRQKVKETQSIEKSSYYNYFIIKSDLVHLLRTLNYDN
jgi:FkbM family methyltransferase